MLRFEALEGDEMYPVSEIEVFTALATAARISPSSDLGVVAPGALAVVCGGETNEEIVVVDLVIRPKSG
jgi:hypothetical protein